MVAVIPHKMMDSIRNHPRRFGLTIRQCSGDDPDCNAILSMAIALHRHPYITDNDGYDCDLLAAAFHPEDSQVTYVEQRSRTVQRGVDVTIKIHHTATDGTTRAQDIESYNPFFGCNIRYLRWHGDSALLIYREKHHTYAASYGRLWPPIFRPIGDRWIINGNDLSHVDENERIHRLSIPELTDIGPLTENQAKQAGLFPDALDGYLDWPENAG